MKRKGVRSLLLLLIGATLGGVGYKVADTVWTARVDEMRKEPLKFLDRLPDVALQLKDFHRAKIEGGRKMWELWGEEARYLKGEKQAVIKKPRFIFYDKNERTLEATGDEGRLFFTDKELEEMNMKGDVQVTYQGYILRTEEAFYFKSKNQVVAPGKVTLKAEGLELEGVGMEIKLEEEKVRLLKEVKTKVDPNQLENQGLRADGKRKS
ncbi:MAG: LPS export ABC transporter periplasmic protein LptC [Deltaproteobacteria bacterium]|nr:LPS export ABC transporter periplasmic protein LptC [Deltaproteobacteria bacterium]